MPLDPLQERIIRAALALPESRTLVLAGGCAVITHGLVERITGYCRLSFEYRVRMPLRARQPDYWITYGQALARLRGRQEDAVKAFGAAERISPNHVRRDPATREVLGTLLSRTRRNSPAGRALRAMVYRLGMLD